MKYALVISGVLAAIALAAPKLVAYGYLLLILPGLVLTFAPTVFLYLSTTAFIRRFFSESSPLAALAAAFGISLLLGWLVMQPFRSAAITAYRADDLPDIMPDQAIELHGHVVLQRPYQRNGPECDYLVLALLYSPRVLSLTTKTAGRVNPLQRPRSAAYSLVSAKADPAVSVVPTDPGQIVRKYPPLAKSNGGRKLSKSIKAVEATWALRLARDERLREVNTTDVQRADWVIRVERESKQRSSAFRRVTILDSKGTVHFRKSYRKLAVPARMFYLGFHASMAGGPVSASFHVGRQFLESGERFEELESAMLQEIKFPVPPCDAVALERLRDHVIRVLDSPTPTNAELDLARRYLATFFFDTKARDHALIARIVGDDRVKEIETEIKNVFSKSKTPLAMKDAFLDRITMDHTSASLRNWLSECLANFPEGTFANPGPNYWVIWNSPEVYLQAGPLVETLADLDPKESLPQLQQILENTIALPTWRERRAVANGIRAALVRLGPQGSDLAPRISELFLRRPSPILSNAGDADDWRFALALMGVSIEDIPVFPSQSPQSAERSRRRAAEKLRRYEREQANKEVKPVLGNQA